MNTTTATEIKIGDIWVSKWGYDQTNADFYRVQSVSAAMITLAKIASDTTWTPNMTGTAQPRMFGGAPIIAGASDGGLKTYRRKLQLRGPLKQGGDDRPAARLESYGVWAGPWDGKAVKVTGYA